MELLELLENRLYSLVAEIASLRGENAQLRKNATSDVTALREENTYLKQALEQEQQIVGAMLTRFDGMLSRLPQVRAHDYGDRRNTPRADSDAQDRRRPPPSFNSLKKI